jgi:CRISPR-associated protein Cmr1
MTSRNPVDRAALLAAGPAPVAVREGVEPLICTVELLTPVFGGGVKTKVPGDPVTPVRGSAVRGQLRFWWRATRGGQYATLTELHAAEKRLWGGPSAPGLVDVVVDASRCSSKMKSHFSVTKATDGKWRLRAEDAELAYFAFPLQPSADELRNGGQPIQVQSIEGALTITCRFVSCATAEDRKAVDAALWAWRCFGGVGGRTRRGFGAVRADVENPGDLLRSPHIIDALPPRHVPSLAPTSGARLAFLPAATSEAAWKQLARKLKRFRQGESVGRNPGQQANRPGRSRWPEADLARALTNRAAPAHGTPTVSVKAAPRAAFGMPIILHFKDKGDPPDVTIKPKEFERLASPLILRPIGTRQKAWAAALLLGNRTPPDEIPGGAVAVWGNTSERVRIRLQQGEGTYRNSPLEPHDDPLDAFLAFLTNEQGA